MHAALQTLLDEYRTKRAFHPEDYIPKKIAALNRFFEKEGIDAVTLGISGGLDSAVALYLLAYTRDEPGSPLRHILPLSLPIHGVDGVTGQDKAANKARLAISYLDLPYIELDLGPAYRAMAQATFETIPQEKRAWAEGQMGSVLRTPSLYYHAALLQAQGFRSLVVGTTNRDEGAYIGFFGKGSDAMVDLQPLGDLHKSEVRRLATWLGVPQEIIDATPRGDVWDNRVDEEMIGSSYDFLELYQGMLEKNFNPAFRTTPDFLTNGWGIPGDAHAEFLAGADAIEAIHRTNLHKYQVGSPARFVDVLDRFVPGGWTRRNSDAASRFV